jgi:phosphoserine phosphatase
MSGIMPTPPTTLAPGLPPVAKDSVAFAATLRSSIRRVTSLSSRPIAAFDLDNTLISGDIGDALFASLARNGRTPSLRWGEYEELLRTKKTTAYRRVVAALDGLSVKEVEHQLGSILGASSRTIVCDGVSVPVPRPRRFMKGLVQELQTSGWEVYVISASAQAAAESASGYFFGIPRERVLGVRSVIDRGRFTRELVEPAPVGAGKADVYRASIGSERPLLVAGDSMLDLPMMDLASSVGICLWCGTEYGETVRRTLAPREFHLLPELLASDLQ